jgi:hypothetical protein
MKRNGKIGLMFVEFCSKILIKKEVRNMKKLLALLVFCVTMSGFVYATANPDSIVLSVTPGGVNYSIAIDSATFDFPSTVLGGQVSVIIGSVTNDGNITSDWECKGNNASDAGAAHSWTLANLVGPDTYGLDRESVV